MLLTDAVILRIEQLCIERNITKYELFLRSGVPQSPLSLIEIIPALQWHFRLC